MCGIIFGRREDKMPIGKAILKRYQKQKQRGMEGFGFITIDKGKISGIHRFEKELEAINALNDSTSSDILFHHRTPTSTPNYKDMTHPIVVKNDLLDKNYYVVHNGVIQNEDDLKLKHEKMGFKYTTQMTETHIIKTISGTTQMTYEQFNDSESLSIEVALYLDGKQESIDAEGTIAFVCIETDKKGVVLNLHYGRNFGNPLFIEDNNDLFFLKSIGDGNKLQEDEIITINYITGKATSRLVAVGKIKIPDPQVGVVVRTIGFGAHDEDVASPYTRFLPNRSQSQLPFEDDEWIPENMGISSDEADEYGNEDWQNAFETYKLSDEYLLELWAEIEALQNDIKECSYKLASGIAGDPMTSEDIVYNEEYKSECISVLIQKQDEANKLEHYLNIKQGRID